MCFYGWEDDYKRSVLTGCCVGEGWGVVRSTWRFLVGLHVRLRKNSTGVSLPKLAPRPMGGPEKGKTCGDSRVFLAAPHMIFKGGTRSPLSLRPTDITEVKYAVAQFAMFFLRNLVLMLYTERIFWRADCSERQGHYEDTCSGRCNPTLHRLCNGVNHVYHVRLTRRGGGRKTAPFSGNALFTLSVGCSSRGSERQGASKDGKKRGYQKETQLIASGPIACENLSSPWSPARLSGNDIIENSIRFGSRNVPSETTLRCDTTPSLASPRDVRKPNPSAPYRVVRRICVPSWASASAPPRYTSSAPFTW